MKILESPVRWNMIQQKCIYNSAEKESLFNICYYRDKTWNSYLKVKSNITCPVKVGHPPPRGEPALPVSRPPRDCPHSPHHPQHSLCRNIFLFMCKQKSHLFKFSHKFASQFYFIILSVSHLECSVCTITTFYPYVAFSKEMLYRKGT